MNTNIPYSKYKRVVITGTLDLTPEQMATFKESCERTYHGDWERVVPDTGTTIISRMVFKQDNMEEILEDIRKIAKECPFLDIKVEFSHDYYDEELEDDIYDGAIGTIFVKNGDVKEE